jgi:Tol biopolymer transport system component
MTRRMTRIAVQAALTLPIVLMAALTASATPPGANGKIVFSCPATPDPDGGVMRAICVMNPDGTGYTRILDGLVDGNSGDHPAWSPDGTKIAFRGNKNASQAALDVPSGNIWVMNADGTNPIQLTFTSTDDRPVWSADGRIAFISYRDHLDDRSFVTSIYVMNADGSNQHAVTTVDTQTFDDQPAWSPDGKRIAFVRFGFTQGSNSIDGGFQEIFTVRDDGTDFRELTSAADASNDAGVSKNSPTWSPDGTRVAFTESPFDANLAFHVAGVVNADGSGEHILTRNADTLPDGPNIDVMTVAWSPDGAILLGSCGYSAPTTITGGERLCAIDAATGAIAPPIATPGFAFDPDWAPAASNANLTIVDCDDPRLADGTIQGSVVIVNSGSCGVFNLDGNAVGGNIDISNDTGVTVINVGSLATVGGNVDISGDSSLTTINVGSLATVGGNIDITETGLTTINVGSLATTGGNIDISENTSAQVINVGASGMSAGNIDINDNTAAQTINLGSIATSGGNLDITGNTSAKQINVGGLGQIAGSVNITGNGDAAVVNVGSGGQVAGSVTIETAGDVVNAGGTQAAGSVTIVANGSTSVSGVTGGTTTDVSVLGGVAAMRVVVPAGAFDRPVAFTLTRLATLQPEPGTGPDSTPMLIQPIGGYVFSFAIPTLNADAQLAFRIDLSQLDADTRAAVLAGAGDGSATIAVKSDAAGSIYQASPNCTGAQTPQLDGCVSVTLLAADGTVTTDPSFAAFVTFAGVAGHFSTYSVVIVKPLPDTTPPAVTIGLTAPNGGVSDGRNGWFISGPVTGTVQAVKTSGRSAITSLTCGSLPLALTGLGTQTVTGTFAIAGDGITHLACVAGDAAGNTSPLATLDVKLDRTAPTLAPTVTPSQIALNGSATVAANAADTGSGLADASCGSLDTSTAGGHSVTCTAADNAGNLATATVSYTVVAPIDQCLGEAARQILAPIARDGSSVFLRGLPVPVRFRICDAAGHSISAKVVSSFRLVATIADGVEATVNLPVRSALPGVGFFWDPFLREWDFLLATDVLKSGTTYVYDIALTDGSHIGFRFTLRSGR